MCAIVAQRAHMTAHLCVRNRFKDCGSARAHTHINTHTNSLFHAHARTHAHTQENKAEADEEMARVSKAAAVQVCRLSEYIHGYRCMNTATHCNTLQHTATYYKAKRDLQVCRV